MQNRLGSIALLAFVLGCSPMPVTEADGGTEETHDAGAMSDAGVLAIDAGTQADAGAPDAGTPDAGELVDAGLHAGPIDAGPVDAGAVDAGTVDAGLPDSGLDAGIVDAGPSCGDGVVAGTEACDDHNNRPSDGCSATCTIELGFSCTGSPSVCVDPCASGCAANTYDIDQNPLTGVCGCEYSCVATSSSDPFDSAYLDENCDGSDGVEAQCVYVSATNGSSSNAGTRQSPLDTISQALAVAQANNVPSVCVGQGVFSGSVTLVPGITLAGGFDDNDPDFKFRRSASVTTTLTATGPTVLVPQLSAPETLVGFTILANTPAAAGSSGVAVAVTAGTSTLTISDCHITVGSGVNGVSGTSANPFAVSAADGAQGQAGCLGMSCGGGGVAPVCPLPGGQGGSGAYNNTKGGDGLAGAGSTLGGTGGGSSLACMVRSSDGQGGSNGNSGTSGNVGSPAAQLGSVLNGAYVPSAALGGQAGTTGKAGGGGGGGGGGSCTQGNSCTCTADTGGGGSSGGCGGLGGGAGAGGFSGGGSFGVLAGGGTVLVTNSVISTGRGGNGGRGGDGVLGQGGGTGPSGALGFDDSGSGGKGGNGGAGGAGGPGGGGSGGPSACVAGSSAATLTISSSSCTNGLGGSAGSGGTNPAGSVAAPGSAGISATQLQL